ncbi:MAG TPA: FtsQ-type POTRA domain-containing protein [Gemmatimonadales bacterium]|nr:FtsQ-type POTRA domain-containing protein [Gemmatimonadales bacterium]
MSGRQSTLDARRSTLDRIRRWFTRKRMGMIAAVVAALALIALAPRALRHASFFRVRRIDLVGARYVTGEQVAVAMKLKPAASVFDDVKPLEKRVFAIAGVRRVTIERRWPGTLVVRIEEAEPVALTPRKTALALMDGSGRILPFDPTRAPADLPVSVADAKAARLIARIKDAEPALFRRIVAVSVERQDVILRGSDWRVVLRADAGRSQLRALATVMDDLARKGRRWRELDARFNDRVFVRG